MCSSDLDEPALVRARAARAAELLERLREALVALDALAVKARGGTADSPSWMAWVAQLRCVFAVADDACRALARLLAEPAGATRPARRWFGR